LRIYYLPVILRISAAVNAPRLRCERADESLHEGTHETGRARLGVLGWESPGLDSFSDDPFEYAAMDPAVLEGAALPTVSSANR
jgi:hypothetical protein